MTARSPIKSSFFAMKYTDQELPLMSRSFASDHVPLPTHQVAYTSFEIVGSSNVNHLISVAVVLSPKLYPAQCLLTQGFGIGANHGMILGPLEKKTTKKILKA